MTERQPVEAREAALAASRAKSEFLSSMSHEIRTPMNAVLGMAELLSETGLDPEQRKYLNIMINNGNSLLDLINDILDLAKVEAGRIELERTPFDLRELADRAARRWRFAPIQSAWSWSAESCPASRPVSAAIRCGSARF